MDHLVEYGIQGFRAGITLFPEWAFFVLSQCRENGRDQQQAIAVLKENYAIILANPEGFGISADSIKRESSLSDVRQFDLTTLPMVDTVFWGDMINALLRICFEVGKAQKMTLLQAQEQLLDQFPVYFHDEIKCCFKSVYAALCYHPGAKQFFVSPIDEVDAYNSFAPHHFSEDDKSILCWLQGLLCKIERMDEYKSLDYSFEGYSERFRACIYNLLDGNLKSESCFRLDVSQNDRADNYSLCLRIDADMFEFNMHAWGWDALSDRYSESILYWHAYPNCPENEDAAKNIQLSEYEYWFLNVNPETRITASLSIDGNETCEFSNRPIRF